jgi:nucleoid DNA-binding protein
MEKKSNKKVLKPINKRKPEVQKNSTDMAKAVQLETGFRADDIAFVVRSLSAYIKDQMMDGNSVNIAKLGIFYPLIKPERTVMSMNGGIGKPTRMKMEARWQMKFRSSHSIQDALLENSPTKEQINKLYKD